MTFIGIYAVNTLTGEGVAESWGSCAANTGSDHGTPKLKNYIVKGRSRMMSSRASAFHLNFGTLKDALCCITVVYNPVRVLAKSIPGLMA